MTGAVIRNRRVLCAATLVVLAAGAACADEVTSKGTVLRGTVTAISADGLTLEPEYGKGAIAIAWADVEDVRTDGSFQILYGDGLELDAPLQGFSDGQLLVGADPATATALATADIFSGLPLGPDGLSWQDRTRSYWRYWDGSLDVGVNIQQATTDSTGFLVGFRTTRKKGPFRLGFAADYRYSTQKRKGSSSETIEDRLFGGVRAEYDLPSLLDGLYAWGSGDATYDAIQKLSIRGIPKAGLGYLIWEEKLEADKRNFLAAEVGGGWVYEKYFSSTGTDPNDYFTIAFGAAAGYHLPYGAHFGWRMDYLPAVDDFAGDYLLRNEAALTMPVVDPIAAKLSVVDEYDSTPAADTDKNSLFIIFGLSVLW